MRSMQKTWRAAFHWGNAETPIDHSIAKHIEYFTQLYNVKTNTSSNLPGNEPIVLKQKSRLKAADLSALTKIVGKENITTDDFSRVRYSAGKFYGDLLKLRAKNPGKIADAVVAPRHEEEILKILQYCSKRKIAVTPFGAGSSVTRALETPKGGIVLDMARHMHRVIEFSPVNSTITVEGGILGPALEKHLNEDGFTCGHFPQSFEYSTVAGWVAARGAGQASTGYGRIEDLTVALRVVTPAGIIETKDYPAASIGPDIKQLFLGSEGVFGVISRVTLKVRRYKPQNTRHVSFFFRNFETATNAMREMMHAQSGVPHLFRISDAEETDVALKMKKLDGTMIDKVLTFLGYREMARCLMLVSVEGDSKYTSLVTKKMKKLARKHGGLAVGSYPVKKWLEQRYSSAYMRDPMMDAGIRIDTIETAVSWEKLHGLHQAVRQYIKAQPQTSCLTHISHVYETGANLYFVFASPMAGPNEAQDFAKFHKGLVDVIFKNGGSLSHHHGIGRLTSDRLREEIGPLAHDILKAIKRQLDPAGIMNPGALNL